MGGNFKFEYNHCMERLTERYRAMSGKGMSPDEAEAVLARAAAVLEGNTPPDWRFTESPSSRFFIVDEETEAKLMGMSYRESEGTTGVGRLLVESIQNRLDDPVALAADLAEFVHQYASIVTDPHLSIVHHIRTVYGRGEKSNISEEKRLFESARSILSHTVPLTSNKIASRPNAIISSDRTLWVRQYLNWTAMDPNAKEYYLFQPLGVSGIDKGRFVIYGYSSDGRLKRVCQEQRFACQGFRELLSRAKACIQERAPIRSECYWKVPTFVDSRLIDLDYKERLLHCSRAGAKYRSTQEGEQNHATLLMP